MTLKKEETIEQLEKILQSQTLHGSESLRAFLRFVVTKALDNEESSLKEYTIATEVFGRSSSRYDSRNDSVVRVQAKRLRSKLQEYYLTEGKNDPLIIDLPKGHYAPTFSYPVESNGSPTRRSNLKSPISSLRAGRWLSLAMPALALVCLALIVYIFILKSNASSPSAAPSRPVNDSINLVWGEFLRTPEPTLVTFSNTLFEGTAETGMQLLNPIDSPIRSAGSPSMPKNIEGKAVTEHYTGIGEVMGVYALGDLFYRAGHSIRVKRSLLLTWDDLKNGNLVVIGSPAENFLLRDLPQQQDFIFRVVEGADGKKSFGVLNTRPREGEQKVYVAKQEGPSRSQISEDYAVISYLKGLDPRNRLMILAGITTFGTQAAAEYVSRPEYIEDLIAHLKLSEDGETRLPPFFQILVKVEVKGGVPVRISYITHHVL
jgi:hypothetical protein